MTENKDISCCSRRHALRMLLGGTVLAGLGNSFTLVSKAFAMDEIIKELELTEAEWKKRLTPEQYRVLRREGTEPAGTSALNNEKREGTFVCAGCDFPLFPSKFKYESGTGWPSFYDVIPGHVETKRDFKMIWPRTEYHCSRCGGHQGHVFEDGPEPTGLRYCNNGVALKFIPKEERGGQG